MMFVFSLRVYTSRKNSKPKALLASMISADFFRNTISGVSFSNDSNSSQEVKDPAETRITDSRKI
jgi:hypothetical protein